MNVAELIRTMRTRSGLTVKELSDRMGATTGQIYSWESGKVIPSAEKLLNVARVTGYQLIFTKNIANYEDKINE